MSNDDQLKKLSQKVYLSYHQDGLIDILLGIGVLGFGLMILTGSFVFNMLSWMPILFYVPLKNRITVPRFGYVQFTSERVKKQRLLIAIAVGLVFFTFGLGLYVFANFDDMPPMMDILFGFDGMMVIAVLFVSMMIIAGLITRLNRLFIYALLTPLMLLGGQALGIEPELRVVFLGTIILLIGIIYLLRFLRAYPLPEDESAR
jgi:hypothetical protein